MLKNLININVFIKMEKDLECTKIKDGLYLGNCRTAQVTILLSRMQIFYSPTSFTTLSIVPHNYPTYSKAMESNISNSN